jgi:hypothetical protein
MTAIHAVARRHSISSQNVIEILATMEIMSEDRPDLFASWLDAKLTGLTEGLAGEARRWAVTLHDGGPRPGHAPPAPHRPTCAPPCPRLRAGRHAVTTCVRSPATTS